MNMIKQAILAGAAALASTQAQAAEWWYVPGSPNASALVFVDGDAVSRVGNMVSLKVVRVDRFGKQRATVQQLQCGRGSSSVEFGDLRDFACATVEQRMHSALLLGSLSPSEAAVTIFASGEGRDQRPASVQQTAIR